ncbi:MAG: ParB/RepB/Spo0J family partition protein [Candidatus Nitrosotenuis sp.]
MSRSKLLLDELIRYVPSEKIPLSQVFFDENNPNKMTKEQMRGLEQFMERIGFAVEIWVNKEDNRYRIIDGEWRVRVLLQRGIKFVWAKIFQVKYSEIRIMRQLANKIGGEHERHKDLEELKAIFEDDNLDEFTKMLGVPIEDIQRELQKEFDITFGPEETEQIPEKPAKPKAKLGDIYKLGNHILMCGDCTNPDYVNSIWMPVNTWINYPHHPEKFELKLKPIDACLAPTIYKLNNNQVQTVSCCCRHMQDLRYNTDRRFDPNPRGSVLITNESVRHAESLCYEVTTIYYGGAEILIPFYRKGDSKTAQRFSKKRYCKSRGIDEEI